MKGCKASKMKQFKTTSDILIKRNDKLNLIEQCYQSTTKHDVDQKVAENKRALQKVNDREVTLPEALANYKPETLFKNDIVIETKNIVIDVFKNDDYRGRYYIVIEKNKCAVCLVVNLHPDIGTYYYNITDDRVKYYLFYNLIKKVTFPVREFKVNTVFTQKEIIKNDDDDQRRKLRKLIEREVAERKQKKEK